jgi:hypothetical protein
MSLFALAPLALSAAAMPPLRPSAEPVDSQWEVVGSTRDGDCALTVTGNGRIFLLSVSGMDAGSPARYQVSNGDMKPLNWRVTSDSSGSFARYYLPFRWHRPGGTVTVSVTSESCTMSSSFQWRVTGTETY